LGRGGNNGSIFAQSWSVTLQPSSFVTSPMPRACLAIGFMEKFSASNGGTWTYIAD
jgi:hypothetical protein